VPLERDGDGGGFGFDGEKYNHFTSITFTQCWGDANIILCIEFKKAGGIEEGNAPAMLDSAAMPCSQ